MRLRSPLFLLCLALAPPCALAQSQALDRAEILGRLAQGYSPSYLAQLVKTRGVSFSVSADFVDRVKRVGGDGILAERLSAATAATGDADRPFDFLARCAEWIHAGAASLAENDCRAAIEENPQSPWPILAALRAIAVSPNLNPQETSALLHRAVALDPSLLSAHRALASTDLPPEEQAREMRALADLERAQPSEDAGSGTFSGDIPLGPFPDKETVTLRTEQRKTIESALQEHPDLAVAHLSAGFAYAYLGDHENSQAQIAEALRLEPGSAELHLALASFYSAQHETESELLQYREAVHITPYDNASRRRLTDALVREKRLEEAIHEWNDFLALSPRDLGASGCLVNLYLQIHDRDSAIVELQRSLKTWSDVSQSEEEFVDARLIDIKRLAQLLYDNREFEAAKNEYQFLLRFKPDASRLHSNLGDVFLAEREHERALAEYQQALRLEPSLSEAHHGLANCLFVLQKTDEAIAEYRQTLEFDPGKQESQVMLGVALTIKGELNSAIDQFQQVLATDPENTLALANLGHAYRLNKDYFSAIPVLRRTLVLKPDYSSAESELAWIYATAEDPHFRDPAQALTHARHAVETSHEPVPALLDTLAEALLLNGQPIEAMNAEEQASRLAPHNAQFQSRLAHFREVANAGKRLDP